METGTEPVTAALLAPADPTSGPPGAVPPSVSRYRSLRGKSVSAPRSRPFDVFEDSNANDEEPDSPTRRRRRSRSVTAEAPRQGLKTGGGRASGAFPFPTSASVLSPKPINLLLASRGRKNSNSNLSAAAKAWAELKPPPPLPIDAVRLQALNKRAAQKQEEQAAAAAAEAAAAAAAAYTGPTTPTTELHRPLGQRDESAHWADEVARLEAETDRILAEQKKLDLARLQATLVTPPPKPRSLILEKLTFFSRSSRRGNGANQPGTPTTIASTIFSLDFSRASSLEATPPLEKMSFIEQGGRGVVPQIDAPASAVNGGERRVTVRCLSSTINLPVTTDTSPVDIIFSSANLMTHNIDPETSIVVECFVVLGLERRLRRYERIRDVMNSWDRDQQSSLLILSYSDRQDDLNLDIASVPRTEEPPSGFTVQLYHSSRPGKWTKRWVTLQESGRIFASKKADGKPTDKDSTALCHLSDFDIYTPKDSEMRRHLKPPKKFCYAIKSQQKTIVFPKGENYVHFFCTDDSKLAKRFHDLVHGWRSWYLVNKQVDLLRKDQAPQASNFQDGTPKSKSVVKSGTHRLKVSVDEKPYTIGQFQPLIDLNRFDKPIEDFGKEFEENKTRAAREAEKPKVLAKPPPQPRSVPQTPQNEREFAAGGLLGDAYDKRKQTETRQEIPKAVEGPFTNAPSLLNGGAVASPASTHSDGRSWIPSAAEHSARIRSQSTRSTRRPMTADTAAIARREKGPGPGGNFPSPPPSRHREGSGRGVKPPSGTPLINFATGGASPSLGSPRGLVPRGNTKVSPSTSGGSLPAVGRQRSRSSASTQAARRFVSEGQPPMPPLPSHPARRDGTPQMGESRRGRDTRPQEPLVNRAK